MVEFYFKLFQSEYNEQEEIFNSFRCDLPQVPQVKPTWNWINLWLYKNSAQPCKAWRRRGKAPGTDGLLVELYKAFRDELGEDLLAVLNESLLEMCLPLSC